MTRAVVIGEALVDVVDDRAHPGGSPLNVAVGLSRLGVPTTLFTRIGTDEHGHAIRQHLDESGVQLGADSQRGSRSSTATVTVADDGHATYEFDLVPELPAASLDGAELVHAGSFSALLLPGAESVRAAFGAASDTALRSFDPNARPDVMGDARVALPLIEEYVRRSHIVKLSDEDAGWLYPGMALERVLERLAELGTGLAVITRGSEGCLALSDAAFVTRSAVPVLPADTIGAGDSFMSGMLAAVLDSPAALAALRAGGGVPENDIALVLDQALRSAAITVSRPGANPPWAEELRHSAM